MKLLGAILILILLPLQAYSFEITMEPQDYQGSYSVMGYSGSLTGSQIVDLEAGLYHMIVGVIHSFPFEVTPSGDVISMDNSSYSESRTLFFQTQRVSIDTNKYKGLWQLPGVTGKSYGASSIVLVKGMKFLVQVGAVDAFILDIDEVGQIRTDKNVGIIDGHQLIFSTKSINIDPSLYKGLWRVMDVSDVSSQVAQEIYLVQSLRYQIQIADIDSWGFFLDESGVLFLDDENHGVISEGRLAFKTKKMNFRVSDSSQQWLISGVNSYQEDSATINLITNVRYRFRSPSGVFQDIEILSVCDEPAAQINMGDWDIHFDCIDEPILIPCADIEMDFESLRCRGRVKVKTQDELEAYLVDYGQRNGKYKSLIIDFNLSQEDLLIQSPCNIILAKRAVIESQRVCLKARRNVRIKRKSRIEAGTIHVEAGRNIKIAHHAKLEADSIYLKAQRKVKIKKKSHVIGESVEIISGNNSSILEFISKF